MSHRKTLDCLPLLEPYSKHFRQVSAAECQKHWTSRIPFTRRCCMRDYAACMFCVPSQELQPVSVVDTSNTRCNTFSRRNQNQPTRQSQWNGAEHANSIVHVQTLIIEDHINVSLGQIIHSIPEMEVKAPAGYLACKGGELPSGSIVTMHLQLSIQSSCVASTVCVTDCHKTRRCGTACYS